MTKKNDTRLLLSKNDTWVRPYFRKYRKLLILVLFLGLLTFICGSALMFTSGYLISKSATRPENILLVYVPIVLTRGFGIGRPVFRYLERLGSHNWVLKMTSDIRLKLYRSLETKASQSKSEFQTGKVLGILAEDIEHIQNLYLRTIFPMLIGLLLYTVIIIAFGFFSIPFALLMLLMIGLLILVIPLMSVLFNRANVYRRKEARHILYNQLTDSVLGVGDWQYSGRHDEFLTSYNESEAQVRKAEEKLNRNSRIQDLVIQVVFGLIVIAIFIWAGNYFTSNGMNGANFIAAFVLAVFPLMDALGPISQGVTEFPNYEDSAERLHSLPSIDSELDTINQQAEEVSSTSGNVSFENVSFNYEGSEKVILNNLNLVVESGSKIAVLGKSGTGKSTLANLLRGDLKPTSGVIKIDEKDISTINDMSKVVGVVNQRPHLFDTTIMNNVRLGNVAASDEEVLVAIQQAGLQSVIDQLPLGADTKVEEGGKRFSGGEQQRIALARILLQDVPIVIIDEPTIGLDPITERQLLKTMFDVLKGKTVVWITHHLMSIEEADRVIFLSDGKIMMNDTPLNLQKSNTHYQTLLALDNN
ncbi:thiol reductant ABC exporter subunit CydC [Vagococcus coleopterorum]|uniref:Thiol reductant ABC exporter subunit CydC n=1 Tax=Vagococcus coleopterorum TaxID=2714946 RepID=A0A6G8AM29_9ENTE|nr:thiol reductant ABC exporter subunit CydC [Vagococcus coleopterorum]QIL46019.1 thiol reductant ABC exporter subunit CydC [Vagococcus coleopterorum]